MTALNLTIVQYFKVVRSWPLLGTPKSLNPSNDQAALCLSLGEWTTEFDQCRGGCPTGPDAWWKWPSSSKNHRPLLCKPGDWATRHSRAEKWG